MPRRRARRPSLAEVAECITLGCFSRDECPDPERFAALSAKIGAWEEEERRLKDPIGYLLRRLAANEGDVTFSDAGPRDDAHRVRLGYYRPLELRYVEEPVPASLGEFLALGKTANLTARTVVTPNVDLAENVDISQRMLTDPEWDWEDEICADLRRRAERLSDKTKTP